jgi:hypothetical protein
MRFLFGNLKRFHEGIPEEHHSVGSRRTPWVVFPVVHAAGVADDPDLAVRKSEIKSVAGNATPSELPVATVKGNARLADAKSPSRNHLAGEQGDTGRKQDEQRFPSPCSGSPDVPARVRSSACVVGRLTAPLSPHGASACRRAAISRRQATSSTGPASVPTSHSWSPLRSEAIRDIDRIA